jgi:hypothetical protein
MGRHSIEAGSKDNWTLYPKKSDALSELLKTEKPTGKIDSFQLAVFNKVYKNPATRDPRGYIIPINQSTTAIQFVNILIKSGIKVHRASADFMVGTKKYLAGSYIVKTNQAFRPHVLDMFEPQDHPNDFLYPGGPPVRPYDAAGWTPAFTMGIDFDRILEDFTGPFDALAYGDIQKPVGKIINSQYNSYGYTFSTKDNASYIAVNELLNAGEIVYKNKAQYFVRHSDKINNSITKLSTDYGIVFTSVTTPLSDTLKKIQPIRIGLWDKYGGSMSSGWLRWIFEQYHFPFKLIYAKEIDSVNLNANYDVLVFVEGAIPALKNEGSFSYEERAPKLEDVPKEFQHTLGNISVNKSIPALNKFLQNGGKIVTIGSSANLAYHVNAPVKNALVEMVAGKEKALPGEKFYIPGSVLQVALDHNNESNWGMNGTADVYYNASPVFKLLPDAIAQKQITPLAWYASANTLRSGWAFGQAYLQDGVAAFETNVGKGKLTVFGPEITFRAQTHGNFKLLFNQLYK